MHFIDPPVLAVGAIVDILTLVRLIGLRPIGPICRIRAIRTIAIRPIAAIGRITVIRGIAAILLRMIRRWCLRAVVPFVRIRLIVHNWSLWLVVWELKKLRKLKKLKTLPYSLWRYCK